MIGSNKKTITSVHNQFLAAICGNLTHVSFGALIGWLFSTATGLQSTDRNETHLSIDPIDDEELSWIIASVFLSAVFGAVFVSWMADGCGKKHTLCTLALVQMGSWAMYMLATNATEMYLGGIMTGFSGGGSFVLMPLFIAEVTEDKFRGMLSTMTTLFFQLGMLISFVVLCFVTPKEATYGLSVLPFLFVFAFVYFPDTPYQLRKENRKELAAKSLYFYRGCRNEAERTSDFMKKEMIQFGQAAVDDGLLKNLFVNRSSRKAFTLVSLTIVSQQLSTNFMLHAYTIGLDIPLDVPLIWLSVGWAALQLIGCGIAYLTIEHIGRKKLFIISSIGAGASLIAFATLLQFNHEPFVVSITIALVAFCTSVGLVPIPIVLATELMPQKIRTMGTTICLSAMWMVGFVLYKFDVAPLIGIDVFAYLVATVSVFVAVVVAVMVPETRARSNDEILWELER